MSGLELARAEAFLSGMLTTAQMASNRYSHTDRVLAAYGVAISCPPESAMDHQQALLPKGGTEWLLMVPITTLFARVFAGHRVNRESMLQASRNSRLHYAADRGGAMLALPEGLVVLAQKYERSPGGAAVAFYNRLQG